MEIAINIPDKIYSYINTQWRDIPKNDSPISIMCNAVIDGTPLPKGHGRLIDADEVIKIANKTKDLHGAIWNTPTIIEADKESEDKE